MLFIISGRLPSIFIPNIHTDPGFSKALAKIRQFVGVKACGISVTEEGLVRVSKHDVPVNCDPVRLVEEDRGVYLITLSLSEEKRVATGGLGEVTYSKGWYVYVGSAKRALAARIRRHVSKRKTCRWHVDYLSLAADRVRAYPVYTDLDIECELASSIRRTGCTGVRGFGSSDCACDTHLFHFDKDPFQSDVFVDVLLSYRHQRGIANFLPF